VDAVGEITVNLYPIWTSVEIKVYSEYDDGDYDPSDDIVEPASFYFKTNYEFESYSVVDGCETLFAYKTSSSNTIALSGKWNYINISKDLYAYNSNVYEITLTPIFVKDILRVDLTNIIVENKKFILDAKIVKKNS
jgi:hypothetical protein